MTTNHDSHQASMKTFFTLREDLRLNPGRIEKTRKLTLNDLKPYMGLSGKFGLFGSDEWWQSIASGKMSTMCLSGVIEKAYVAGQDHVEVNTLEIRTLDGKTEVIGIYTNDKTDLNLFKVGHAFSIEYALDEFKPTPQGDVEFSRTALEMAVSTNVVRAD